ncbi:hypothetical protein A5758_02450 [Mycobacterium sp. 852014-50255_SCH5639931]|nr:hypothetical protein A5758_02450 [Mycobacterium sp. 852014-50255_SCH5639931]
MALLTFSHPETVRRLLTTVNQRKADGGLPLPRTTHYPIHDAPPRSGWWVPAPALPRIAECRHATPKTTLN